MLDNVKKSNNSNKISKTLSVINEGKFKKSMLIKKLWRLDGLRWHKFMTKEILNKAEKIWKQEENSNPVILVKYFSPSMTFYVTEIDINNSEQAFWYVVDESYWQWELGYINLEELSLSRNRIWMPVERDLYFDKNTLNDVKWVQNKDFSDNLIVLLDSKVNGDLKYEKLCCFSNNDDTNEFEVVWKYSDGQPNWDNIIISHKDIIPSIKDNSDENIYLYVISELNNRLERIV
jgi:hypothetical protein